MPGYILVAVLATALLFVGANALSPQPASDFGSLLTSDSLGGLFALVTTSVALLVAVASIPSMVSRSNGPLYCSLLCFSALGMLFLSYSADLLMLFVAWELMSLPTYALAGFDKSRVESNEASAKFAILGALSSGIILYAISLSYGLSGSTQIVAVVRAMGTQTANPLTLAAVLLFIVGFGFKMSIVPFHMWAPDTYEGAPLTVTTLLAAGTKKAGFAAAIRVVLALSTVYVVTQNPIFTVPNILAVLALATMTLGNVAALTQKSVVRMLAYSSIAQAGYILIGFVIFSYAQQNVLLRAAGDAGHDRLALPHHQPLYHGERGLPLRRPGSGRPQARGRRSLRGARKEGSGHCVHHGPCDAGPGWRASAQRVLVQAPALPFGGQRSLRLARGRWDTEQRLQPGLLPVDREEDVHGRALEHREDR